MGEVGKRRGRGVTPAQIKRMALSSLAQTGRPYQVCRWAKRSSIELQRTVFFRLERGLALSFCSDCAPACVQAAVSDWTIACRYVEPPLWLHVCVHTWARVLCMGMPADENRSPTSVLTKKQVLSVHGQVSGARSIPGHCRVAPSCRESRSGNQLLIHVVRAQGQTTWSGATRLQTRPAWEPASGSRLCSQAPTTARVCPACLATGMWIGRCVPCCLIWWEVWVGWILCVLVGTFVGACAHAIVCVSVG